VCARQCHNKTILMACALPDEIILFVHLYTSGIWTRSSTLKQSVKLFLLVCPQKTISGFPAWCWIFLQRVSWTLWAPLSWMWVLWPTHQCPSFLLAHTWSKWLDFCSRHYQMINLQLPTDVESMAVVLTCKKWLVRLCTRIAHYT